MDNIFTPTVPGINKAQMYAHLNYNSLEIISAEEFTCAYNEKSQPEWRDYNGMTGELNFLSNDGKYKYHKICHHIMTMGGPDMDSQVYFKTEHQSIEEITEFWTRMTQSSTDNLTDEELASLSLEVLIGDENEY